MAALEELLEPLVVRLAAPLPAATGEQAALPSLPAQGRELDQLPADAPIQFVPSSCRVALLDGRDRPDRRLWELALAFAVRDALRSGDLYLAESRHHVSFWNLVYATDQWSAKREHAYAELSMPTEFDQMVGHLRTELDAAAQSLATGLETNPFAEICGALPSAGATSKR